MAIDHIGVALFLVPQKSPLARALPVRKRLELRERIVKELGVRTGLRVDLVKNKVRLNSSDVYMRKVAERHKADSVLTGEFRGTVLLMSLSTRNGRTIAFWEIPLPERVNASGEKLIVEEVVSAVVNAIPYRGVVAKVNMNQVNLALHSRHGVKPGDTLHLTEFTDAHPTFSGRQEVIAEVKVTEVKGRNAVARVVSQSDEIPEYSKVASTYVDNRRMLALARVSDSFYVTLGTELFHLDTNLSNKTKHATRDYNIDFTPLWSVGLGYGRFGLEALYGTSSGDNGDVTVLQGTGLFEVGGWGDNNKGAVVSLGARFLQLSATDPALRAISSYAPLLDVRWQWVPRPMAKIFVGATGLFLLTTTGQESGGALLGSVGGEGYGGLRLDLSRNFGIEIGTRLQYARVPLDQFDGYFELQLGLFGRTIFMF